jgi:hypothetical protein
MVDACVVRRPGPAATDAVSGVVTPTWTLVYSGPCKVQESAGLGSGSSAPDAGEHAYTVLSYVLHLPVSASGPREGDIAEITAAVLDASLVGRRYRISQEFAKSYATARRLQVEETTS